MTTQMTLRLLGLALMAAPLAAQTATSAATSQFQPNDQILLEVEGDTQFTHAFIVGPGPALMLPVIGPIPLVGVQRAQVEQYLTQQLGHYLKNPVVHAKVLVRLSVLGEVEHPGFYSVRADGPVSDALMAAGGPTKDAKFGSARVERVAGDPPEGGGNDLQDAIARGLTVDAMGLHSGDRIFVPKRHDTESTFRIIGILAGIPAAILIATHLH